MIQELLKKTRFQTRQVARFASRYQRAARYGLDLVLWSRLLSKRRAPIPIDLPLGLLAEKNVFVDAPTLFVADAANQWTHWDEGFRGVNASLFLNLQKPDVISEIRYAHPAPSFNGIYLWDSAFIAQIWKYWDQQVAFDVNRAVLAQQKDGRLPHVVASFTESIFTQPPVMGWSMEQLLHLAADLPEDQYVDHIYEPLVRYHEWLYAHRCHENGLFFWAHPYESGIDNSPRFSSRDESVFADTRQMVSPDFSAYVVLQSEALATMADRLGLQTEADQFRDQRDSLREVMNRLLWDEADGFYYDLDLKTDSFIRSTTIAGLLPLWAGVPDSSQAKRLRQRIMDPEQFNTLIPLPSVARNDENFAKDMWCGPVWINTAYAVICGLRRYGFDAEAADLSFRLCDGVYRTYDNLKKLYEFYDPDRNDLKELQRKQGNRFKYITLGSKPVTEFVGWTGLVNTLVIEQLMGLSFEHGELSLSPNFPPNAANASYHLKLPQLHTAISVDVGENGATRCAVRQKTAPAYFELAAGETWQASGERIIPRSDNREQKVHP
ncbi:MGH1-like glycoside hydrolase domain-containing protein [Rubinisphaera margarita]|uniref:MGH1-like glycoside hydrolase domain-containing protein n=1 Tax=Rubinisphaera margarita TaxID=2909586 RepID=UPI001EE8DF53|nr:trehalase family glycosidase [Rubinisphaera margarita]MCG6157804.1 hypothetical protein [Rubinisphaera margarita]